MDISRTPHIVIPDGVWVPTGDDEGDPHARLLATIRINGGAFHVEAYAVKLDEHGCQVIADGYFQDEWDGLCLLEPNEAFETQTINGRDYVIVARPFGR
jgi:hypothetical protein